MQNEIIGYSVHMINLKHFVLVLSLFLLGMLSGCSPSSLEDYRLEGEARCRTLLEELQKIHNREQLVKAAPHLKKYFNNLVTLMIHAREFQETHPDETPGLSTESNASSELEEELRRIYAIEGAREIIERAQQEALVRLDAFERARSKRRQAIS